MAARTQLRPQHATGRRYGSFAGRPDGGLPPPTVVIYGGDDAPRIRKKRKTFDELFREVEATIHTLVSPPRELGLSLLENVAQPTWTLDAQLRDLLALAEASQASLARVTALRRDAEAVLESRRLAIERDDEDFMMWF